MLGANLRYVLRHPERVISALASDPVALWDKFQDGIAQRREYRTPVHYHEPVLGWERRLHDFLGIAWPCEASHEFWSLWPEVIVALRSAGVDVGPASFQGYNDGDAGLVRAIWCLTRHLGPKQIVETGVGHGVTSRFILEALAKNGAGHLSSIDRPPLDPDARDSVGLAVGARFGDRWSLIFGSSRRCLPDLLSKLERIELFVHDSLHTERNLRFELDCVWNVLRPGGALVIDDIDTNAGFRSFTRDISGFKTLVCEAEPIRPDTRRFNKKGLFGIILKE